MLCGVRIFLSGGLGFHVHAYGIPPNGDCTKAAGHYNPEGKNHGGPTAEVRHHGDLGNKAQSQATNSNGKFKVEFSDRLV